MTPPTHAALAYVVYRATHRALRMRDVVVITLFALLPDLVDKTAHYTFGWFASGRTMLHNVFVLTAALALWWYGRRPVAIMAAVGIASHIVSDFLSSFLRSLHLDFSDMPGWWTYMLFPLADPELDSRWYLVWTDFALEIPILGVALVYLWRDYASDSSGRPWPGR